LLIVFLKLPEAGKVKTRLIPAVGADGALKVYRKLLEHTAKVTVESKLPIALAYSPALPATDNWPAETTRFLQKGKNLGERLADATEAAFAQGVQKVLLIGADCYQLQPLHLLQAVEELKTHNAVIGPATDGGYYLLGLRKYSPAVFSNIRWSSEHVFAETKQRLEEQDMSYSLLPELADVDRPEDLGQLDP
jgi:rSAM/selenodomain-associated transferase 1